MKIQGRNLIFLMLFAFTTLVNAAQDKVFFNGDFGDYQKSLAEAGELNKQAIFIFFYLDDCPFCHKMRQQVFNKKAIINFYQKHFLNYQLDANGSVDIVDFAGNDTTQRQFAVQQHNVFATPVLVFFDLTGKVVAYRTGFLSQEDFLLLGRFVQEKQYLTSNFMRYKRKLKRLKI